MVLFLNDKLRIYMIQCPCFSHIMKIPTRVVMMQYDKYIKLSSKVRSNQEETEINLSIDAR